jgi:hypothetical protein
MLNTEKTCKMLKKNVKVKKNMLNRKTGNLTTISVTDAQQIRSAHMQGFLNTALLV